MFFGHAYKGQTGDTRLLRRFTDGGGTLLDLEYLTDDAGRRLAAFGFWAGYVGGALGSRRDPRPGPRQIARARLHQLGHPVRPPLDIAIDNLPSLLPKESSTAFAADLLPHLRGLAAGAEPWRRCAGFFRTAVRSTEERTHV